MCPADFAGCHCKRFVSKFMLMASVSDEGGKQNKINGSFA